MEEDQKKIKERTTELKKEVRERTVGYIVAALGLVAGLAWNDAVKSLIEYFFPLQQNTVFAKFLYALFITFVIVLVSIYLTRLAKGNDKGK